MTECTFCGVSVRVISILSPSSPSTVAWIRLTCFPCQCLKMSFCGLILHASRDAEPENLLKNTVKYLQTGCTNSQMKFDIFKGNNLPNSANNPAGVSAVNESFPSFSVLSQHSRPQDDPSSWYLPPNLDARCFVADQVPNGSTVLSEILSSFLVQLPSLSSPVS